MHEVLPAQSYCGLYSCPLVDVTSVIMVEIPKLIIGVSRAAAVISVIQAITTVVVGALLLLNYDQCPDTSASAGGYFFRLLSIHYLKDSRCSDVEELQGGIMEAATFRIWVIIHLSFSAAWLVVSMALMFTGEGSEKSAGNIYQVVGYTWAAMTTAVVIVDISLGVMFSIDYYTLNNELGNFAVADAGAYRADLLRLAAFCMMTISFKGYALTLLNLTMVVIILVCGSRVRHLMATVQHSVHTQGFLRAFSTSSLIKHIKLYNFCYCKFKELDPWRQQPNNDALFRRISQSLFEINRQYWQDVSAQPTTTELRSFDRSDSWHHSKTGTDVALRPSVSRSDAPSPSTSTATGGPESLRPWDSNLPPLPAPDYSPPTSRRLKSALKPTY